MKRTIRLSESDLHRVIEESVKRILNESGADSNEKERQMRQMWKMQNGKRPDINSKRTQKRFNWNDKQERYPEEYGEKAAKEFMNRPNAASDYEHFPRRSQERETDFNSLKNGSERMRTFKNKREREREEREEQMIKDKQKNAENTLWKIGFKVEQSGYDPSSITQSDIDAINGLIKDNEALGGKVFPDYEINNGEGIWLRLLLTYMDSYVGYNPYRSAMLAYQFGFIPEPPKNKELDVNLRPYKGPYSSPYSSGRRPEYDWDY